MRAGLEDVLVGHWTDEEAETGITVVLSPPETMGAMAVRGGAPGTREAASLTSPRGSSECHAVVLCGASVFGLAAADGVARWCVDQARGYLIRDSIVPVVAAAVVYDITSPTQRRPTADDGWAACEAASALSLTTAETARIGVGRGCSVGKSAGRDFSVTGGLGLGLAASAEISVAALVAVNSVGDVIAADGSVLAGSTAPPDAPRYPYTPVEEIPGFDSPAHRQNTTIGCIITNAALTKPEAIRAADLSHTGIARAIEPPHTDLDGDALFVLATGQTKASADLVATLGTQAVAAAIRNAVV